MKIRDMFNDSFCFDIELSKNYVLYVEGLDIFGCGIYDKNYKVEDIEHILVELVSKKYNVCETLPLYVNIDTTIEDLKEIALEYILGKVVM